MDEALQIRSGFSTQVGKRDSNEDYVAVYDGDIRQRSTKGVVAAIADGMGGARGGRQAAETTVRGFFDAYLNLPETL
ncbi:MAG TPA: bifunctional protein-serine/threonine kinase/phosphatase, partial [Gammaproteobacteria bacterium]|nr:bifunctional protein-serine/threonine kinase/phosphatase [Gammaproteobacteria bacterium]